MPKRHLSGKRWQTPGILVLLGLEVGLARRGSSECSSVTPGPKACRGPTGRLEELGTGHNLPSQPTIAEEQQALNDAESALDPAFRQTIQVITANITKVKDGRLCPLSRLVETHSQQLKEIEERTTEMEDRISATEHTTGAAEKRIKALESQIQALTEHVDDLENRGRRKNIQIIGLPEEAEGSNPTRFFETWIPSLLGMEAKNGRVKIERAHRTLAPKPGPNQRPRPILIRFHNFVDKQRVLDAGRVSVKFQESSIMFFQDLSAAVMPKRKGFYEVKKHLRYTGAKYMMLYPATLKILHHGEARSFDSPERAMGKGFLLNQEKN
uniref:L1 transposable element RRM domain-containing protein n=1 Tax=Oryzias latipes TaxID=8090 RepID=A0A3P9HWN9_ORYLA